jgi:hypothetical protein
MLKTAYFPILMTIFGFSTASLGAESELDQTYDLTKMEQMISSVKQLEALPTFGRKSDVLVTKSADSIPAKSQAIFARAQNTVFGKQLVELKACDYCKIIADYYALTVRMESDPEKIFTSADFANPDELLYYIFVHELSHFVHELSTLSPYSPNSLSVNGLPSGYKHGQSLESGLKMHSEVEIYAILILLNSGFTDWDDVTMFMENSIAEGLAEDRESAKITARDFANRLRNVKSVLARQHSAGLVTNPRGG